eukprot:TRINITY_DN22322_c0_g1_i1.p1 TRINITY_DN22322_c0_g1~~TRINITY_DN22322_c0_g1_i1.p1  ORF type:complete len:142 (+),score=13.02 TRINITY_DN22322_c0_g1_i1:1-426(+)
MGCCSSDEEVALLSNRPLEHPQRNEGDTEIWVLKSSKALLRMDPQGRVTHCSGGACVGWVDATGTAYANDYDRSLQGKVDFASGEVSEFTEGTNQKAIGNVDQRTGEVVKYNRNGLGVKVGFVTGPGVATGGCALLTLASL